MFKFLKSVPRKNLLRFSLWFALVSVFLASVGFTDFRQSEMPCSALQVTVHDSDGNAFIEASDIREIIQNKFGSVEGKLLNGINISLLEKIILTNPFIARAEVFSTVDGKLNIDVIQRKPVLRVINYTNESYYVDDQGVFMPLSEKYTARVPVVNGFLFDRISEKKVWASADSITDLNLPVSKLEQVFNIATFLHAHEFWAAQVQQLYVNVNGDIELISRVGAHTIILGDAGHLDEKFSKLFLFYSDALNKGDWNRYSAINLKFDNQVVCTKR